MYYSQRKLINFRHSPALCNYTWRSKCYPSLSMARDKQWSEQWGSLVECGGKLKKKIAFIAALALPMQIFIGGGGPIVAILLAYNGFLCTQATGRLAEIIFPSCLARLQLRNKLLVEARGRWLIIGASHPNWPFSYSFFSPPPPQLQWQKKNANNLCRRGHTTCTF